MLNAAGTVALTSSTARSTTTPTSAASSRRSASTSGRPITPTPRCCCTPTRSGASTASSSFYGMFAVGIYDARDAGPAGAPPGSRPRRHQAALLHADHARRVAVRARRFAACWRIPIVSAEMDRTAFWHYLTFIVTPAPLTLFRGIFKLPAGHTMTIDHTGRATARQWWDCQPDRARRRCRETRPQRRRRRRPS